MLLDSTLAENINCEESQHINVLQPTLPLRQQLQNCILAQTRFYFSLINVSNGGLTLLCFTA
jgi:hypothetical protein